MSKPELYQDLISQLRALLGDEQDFIANAANTAALIFRTLPELNWAGFYFLKDGQLVLGPFQGNPACTRIAVGRGVCGTAAQRLETLVVENVHEFPGHIACDAASLSEIVVPIIKQDRLLGVLDLDSSVRGRFDAEDRTGLESLVEVFIGLTESGGE